MDNKFLHDFIKMRQSIALRQAPTNDVKKGNKKVNTLTQIKETPEIDLAYIINKKPGKSKVIEYLKTRANELEEEL
jgi:hypothetical protein